MGKHPEKRAEKLPLQPQKAYYLILSYLYFCLQDLLADKLAMLGLSHRRAYGSTNVVAIKEIPFFNI